MDDSSLLYGYTCPSCSGAFSMPLDRIPPVRARFPCGTCGEPMDFPSREQATIHARLQAEAAARAAASAELEKTGPIAIGDRRFRVDKRGWEDDYFDRRGLRNLIRTGEVLETDHIFVEGDWKLAGGLPELKPLFDLRKKSRFTPPRCCRTHTDRLAHFVCRETDRPLCEECAPERKFGASMVRMCGHCGGTTTGLAAS